MHEGGAKGSALRSPKVKSYKISHCFALKKFYRSAFAAKGRTRAPCLRGVCRGGSCVPEYGVFLPDCVFYSVLTLLQDNVVKMITAGRASTVKHVFSVRRARRYTSNRLSY